MTVDELVREGEAPQPPEPPQPQVVYVERKREGLTGTQIAGVISAAAGAALALIGFAGAGWAILIAAALILLSLPLLLAKKHPWLIAGWLLAAISVLVLNPYTSVAPWGLAGGLRYVLFLIRSPEMRYRTSYFAAAVGIIRGLLTLILLYFTWRTRRDGKASGKTL